MVGGGGLVCCCAKAIGDRASMDAVAMIVGRRMIFSQRWCAKLLTLGRADSSQSFKYPENGESHV